jgi:hypothetical protein
MKHYYSIEPDVPGGLGPETRYDRSGARLEVALLHYEFEDWFGDCLVTSSPCFMVTDAVARSLEEIPATGCVFEQAKVTLSENFREFNPEVHLPDFVWLKVLGRPGVDDFGLSQALELIVSERVLRLFEQFGIPRAEYIEWKHDGQG